MRVIAVAALVLGCGGRPSEFQLDANDGDGGGPPAALAIDPSDQQDYGTVQLATLDPANVKIFTIKNDGEGTTGKLAAHISGAGAGNFVIMSTSCDTLAKHGMCTVSVNFAPSGTTAVQADLVVGDGSVATPTVTLVGAGATSDGLAFAPPTKDYGMIPVSSASAPTTFMLTNTATTASGTLSVQTGTSHFTIVSGDNCRGYSLAPNQSCQIAVKFTPSTSGPHSGQLVATSVGGASAKVDLAGTGVAATLTITPPGFTFPPVTIGQVSQAQTFTVASTGVATTGPVAVSISSGPFTITGNGCAGAMLTMATTCTFHVQFTPAGSNSATGALMATATPGGMGSASVGGAGAAPMALTPKPVPDMSAHPGESTSATVTLTNPMTSPATGPLGLISFTGPTGVYAVANNGCTPGMSLPPGGMCSFTVTFLAPGTATPGQSFLASVQITATPGGTASDTLSGFVN